MIGCFDVDVKATVNDSNLNAFAPGASLLSLLDGLSRYPCEFLELGGQDPLGSVDELIIGGSVYHFGIRMFHKSRLSSEVLRAWRRLDWERGCS